MKVTVRKTQPKKYPECSRFWLYLGRERVGGINACKTRYRIPDKYGGYGTESKEIFQVLQSNVKPEHQRKGYGTKLYEAAANEACRRGISLASSPRWARSPMSTRFWAKQIMKDRADEHVYDGVVYLRQSCDADLSEMRLPDRWPWYAGGAAALLLLLSGGKASAARMPSGGRVRNSDIDALTRMLLTETGFKHSRDEMAQIVNVAVNRARKHHLPLAEVVSPYRRAYPAWNTHSTYRDRFNASDGWAAWQQARSFVIQVLNGDYPNRGYTGFVHPGAPRFAYQTPCRNAPRWAPTGTPGWGTRCLPTWVHGGDRVGRAMFST